MTDQMIYLNKVYEAFNYKGRPFLKHAWRQIIDNDIVIVEAPTGYGKTALSQAFTLYTLEKDFKTIISFPLRSLLEDQIFKFKHLMKELGREDIVGTRYMHHLDSYYFVKPVTLTTIDTLSMCLFGLEPKDLDRALRNTVSQQLCGLEPRDLDKSVKRVLGDSITWTIGHYLYARSTVLLSNIILDEVHLLADTVKSLNFLASLLIIALQNGLKLLLISATLPEAFLESIRSVQKDITIVRFDESIDPEFVEERERKEINYIKPVQLGIDKYDEIIEWLRKAKKELQGNGLRALLVFNTVSEALEMYEYLIRSEFREYDIILLHSRYTEKDRYKKLSKLRMLMNKYRRSIAENKDIDKINYIIISTQVIEAGVDISSNAFITDIAPANSLIQRLGRFLRYPGEKYGVLRIWYEEPKDKKSYKKVYNVELVKRTINELKTYNDFNPHLPSTYCNLLNKVYHRRDFRIKYTEVSELVNLTLSLESPRNSVKKFLRLGGSFIRELPMVPVIASNTLKDEDLAEKIVPIGINVLRPDIIVGKAVKKEGKIEIVKNNYIVTDLGKYSTTNLLKLALDPSFIAFIVRGEYDSLKGLVLERD